MNVYAEKNRYVESLNNTLSVVQDFQSVSYAWDALTGAGLELIFKNIVKTLLSNDRELPFGIVHDRQQLRKIAPLFKRA